MNIPLPDLRLQGQHQTPIRPVVQVRASELRVNIDCRNIVEQGSADLTVALAHGKDLPGRRPVIVVCLMPDGVTYLSAVQLSPTVIVIIPGPSPLPLASNVPLTSGTVSAAHLFNGTEPGGTYYTYAALVVAGSNPFAPTNQLAFAVQPFQFSR